MGTVPQAAQFAKIDLFSIKKDIAENIKQSTRPLKPDNRFLHTECALLQLLHNLSVATTNHSQTRLVVTSSLTQSGTYPSGPGACGSTQAVNWGNSGSEGVQAEHVSANCLVSHFGQTTNRTLHDSQTNFDLSLPLAPRNPEPTPRGPVRAGAPKLPTGETQVAKVCRPSSPRSTAWHHKSTISQTEPSTTRTFRI